MAWDDVGDERRELLGHVGYDARYSHYKAKSRSLLYFLVVTAAFLVTISLGFWYVFTRLSIVN